jgi:hypothetical protein
MRLPKCVICKTVIKRFVRRGSKADQKTCLSAECKRARKTQLQKQARLEYRKAERASIKAQRAER